jgi:hypothetical protein
VVRKVPSTIATSGSGTDFEADEAAYAVACLLAEEPYLDNPLGAPVEVRFQTRGRGWRLDDILVSCQSKDALHRCAVSVRMNEPVNRRGFPSEFVLRCWEQLLAPEASAFDPLLDRLVLASTSPGADIITAVNRLSQHATNDPARLQNNLSSGAAGNELSRALYESFSCPSSLRTPEDPLQRAALLGAVRVLPLDYEEQSSRRENEALRLCRSLVDDDSDASARSLWQELRQFVRKVRPFPGPITQSSAVAALREQAPPLRCAPSFSHDWERIRSLSARRLKEVGTAIGKTHLSREAIQRRILDAWSTGRAILVHGDSGVGKSSTIRSWLEAHPDTPSLFLTPEDIEELQERPTVWGLRHALSEVIEAHRAKNGALVIDGIDSSLDPLVLASVRACLRATRPLTLGWRLVASSQTQHIERVLAELVGAGIDTPERVEVGPLDIDECRELMGALPALKTLLATPGSIFATPQVLSLLVQSGATIDADWVGESDALEAWWNVMCRAQPEEIRLRRVAESIARLMADCRRQEISTRDLGDSETGLLSLLTRLGILRVSDDRIRFSHDIIGDFIRSRHLRSLFNGVSERLAALLLLPEWRNAGALLAGALMEEAARTGNSRRVRELLALGTTTCDLLAERALMVPYAARLLDVLSPLLGEGGLGARIVLMAWRIATEPAALRPEAERRLTAGQQNWAASSFRLPVPSRWTTIVSWLVRHEAALRPLAARELVRVARASLEFVEGAPYSSELASLALSIAGEHTEDTYFRGDKPEAVTEYFRVAILAGHHHPDVFRALVRQLAGMEPPTASEKLTPVHSVIYGEMTPEEPWPHGPLRQPHRLFRTVALSADEAERLTSFDPAFARDVFLALTIAPPGYHSGERDDDLRVAGDDDGDPPYTDFGPLRSLLVRAPDVAMDFLVRLVDFATDRYVANDHARAIGNQNFGDPNVGVTISVDGMEKRFVGDAKVFSWYTGVSLHHVVGSVLMTIEAHLYSVEGAAREWYCRELLRRSHSVAILGVLSAVAVKEPGLLDGALEGLLDDPTLLRWSIRTVDEASRFTVDESWPNEQAEHAALRKAWRHLPHHEINLRDRFIEWLAGGGFQWTKLERLQTRWRRHDPDELHDRAFVERMLRLTDSRSYRMATDTEGRAVYVFEESESDQQGREALLKEGEPVLQFGQAIGWQRLLEEGRSLTEHEREVLEASVNQKQGKVQSTSMPFFDSSLIPTLAAGTLLTSASRELAKQTRRRCERLIERALRTPPAPAAWDSRETRCGVCWDTFAVAALPTLLSTRRLGRRARRLLYGAATAPHNDAVRHLLVGLLESRKIPEVEVSSLLHLIVRRARLEYVKGWVIRRKQSALKNACQEEELWLRRQYVSGRLGALPSDWPRLKTWLPRGRSLLTRIHFWRNPITMPEVVDGVERGYVRAAFGWLADERGLTIAAERAQRQERLLQVAEVLRTPAHGVVKPDDEQSPWDPDTLSFLVQTLTSLAFAENDAQRRRALWRNFVSNCGDTHALGVLPEFLIRRVYRQGASLAAGQVSAMVRELFDVFTETQVFEQARHGHSYRDVTQAFLGPSGNEYWTGERQTLFESLDSFFRTWFATFGDNCVAAFIDLLRTPAASTRRLALLGLITPGDIARDRDAPPALRSLLEICWSEQQADIKAESTVRAGFLALVQHLVSLGDPRAIVFHQRIIEKVDT